MENVHYVINSAVSVQIRSVLNVKLITISILFFRNVYYKWIQLNNVDSIVLNVSITKIVTDV